MVAVPMVAAAASARALVAETRDRMRAVSVEVTRKPTLCASLTALLVTSPTPSHALATAAASEDETLRPAPTPAPLTVLCGYLVRAVSAFERSEAVAQKRAPADAAAPAPVAAAAAAD